MLRNKKEQGITLVALVITVIIIIILATVTINFAFGENGLIKRAEQASEFYANDTKYTEDSVANVEKYLDGMLPGGSEGDEEDPIDPPTPDYPTEVEGVTIPEGFYYVGGTKSEGIVISDKVEDAGKGTSHEVAQTLVGNQFVWIPVEDDNAFKTYEGYWNGSLDFIIDNCSEPFASGYINEQSEYDAMKASVLSNDGFYVGRYEAGTTNAARNDSTGITDPVLVQQGKYVYNYVGWSNSNDMTNELGGAVELSKNFDTVNGYTSVTSTLIYGVQWDAIMNFIDPAYATGTCAEDSFVRDSSGKGNYNSESGSLAVTGARENYAVKNIYDLGGNAYEWTMEAYDTIYRVSRGGNYIKSGSDDPTSIREYDVPLNWSDSKGFRLALYLGSSES